MSSEPKDGVDDEASEPADVRISELEMGGEPLVILSLPMGLPESMAAALSEAERQVVNLLLLGNSNTRIAEHRGTAVRTVANQVAAIFAKLDVSSRAELAAKASPWLAK